jgi:hypothetical protein
VYAEYVENSPADDYTPCKMRAIEAKNRGELWLSTWDTYFLGNPPSADNGVFGLTAQLIVQLDCSWPMAQWMNHVSNISYALQNIQSKLAEAEVALNQLQVLFNQLFQDCPVPRE